VSYESDRVAGALTRILCALGSTGLMWWAHGWVDALILFMVLTWASNKWEADQP